MLSFQMLCLTSFWAGLHYGDDLGCESAFVFLFFVRKYDPSMFHHHEDDDCVHAQKSVCKKASYDNALLFICTI